MLRHSLATLEGEQECVIFYRTLLCLGCFTLSSIHFVCSLKKQEVGYCIIFHIQHDEIGRYIGQELGFNISGRNQALIYRVGIILLNYSALWSFSALWISIYSALRIRPTGQVRFVLLCLLSGKFLIIYLKHQVPIHLWLRKIEPLKNPSKIQI